jgi:CheY-like chemotaxis protein
MDCPEIVVIEDDEYIRESVREVLEGDGYLVRAFTNGKEALEGLRECSKPCLILLDLMMPVMDGREFMRHRIDLGDTVVATPVFIVSAVGDPQRVREMGASGYVKKPIDIDVLLNLVHAYCGRQSHEAGDLNHDGKVKPVRRAA